MGFSVMLWGAEKLVPLRYQFSCGLCSSPEHMALQSKFLLGAYSSNGGISRFFLEDKKKAAKKNSPAHTLRNKLQLDDISIQKNKK